MLELKFPKVPYNSGELDIGFYCRKIFSVGSVQVYALMVSIDSHVGTCLCVWVQFP
jgi:hypothetical protein